MNNERKTGGFSFFTLWFGAAVSLAEIMTGSFISPLGIKKGVIVIIAGHLVGCLILALVGMIGFREGKPSLVSSRISLGRYGSYIISVLNILQLVGWTAIMLIQCSRSVQSVAGRLIGMDSFVVITLFVGVLVAVWALYAEKGISLINNIAVVLLIGLSIFVIAIVLKGGASAAAGADGSISFGASLELSIIMPLTWVPLISDYTMKGKTGKGSFWGSFAGYFTGSSLMYAIGLIAAVYTGNSDLVSMLSGLDMGILALVVVILATVTTTFLDVFSAVFSTLNLAPGIPKRLLIILITAFGTLLALFFPMEQYENFLYIIESVFAPAFTVIIIDYFCFKRDRSQSFINIPGFVAAAAGTVGYYIVGRFDLIIGMTIPSMLIAGLLYAAIRLVAPDKAQLLTQKM